MPSSVIVSLNQGCLRACLAVMRDLGSYWKMRRKRSMNCLLNEVPGGMTSYRDVRCDGVFGQGLLTGRVFMALTYFLDVLGVS